MDIKSIKLLQKQINNTDCLLVTNLADTTYILEKSVEGVTVAITNKNIYLLTSEMISPQAKFFFPNQRFIVDNDPIKRIIKLRQIEKIKTLLTEENISIKLYNTLHRHFNIKLSNVLKNLRMVKKQQEIIKIKKSCGIANKVIHSIRTFLKEGVSELEIKNIILKKFLELGVEKSFDPIVAFDENTVFPHHIPTTKKFGKKSFALIDLGCKMDGYCSDITRMFFVEKSLAVRNFFNKLYQLQKQLISMCTVGEKVSNIDNFARKFCKDLGIEKNYLHSTGHGVGLEIHESPRISVKDNTVLKEGMIITIEPGIYFNHSKNFKRSFGLRVEDMVLITKNGPVVLTKTKIT